MSKFRCRQANLGDLEKIADFQIQMAKESENLELNRETLVRGIRGVFEAPHRGFYLVVEHETDVVGSMLVQSEWSDWRNGEVFWIHSVYVVPEWRKRGVFRMLYVTVKEMVDALPERRGLRLYVEKHNDVAQKTYQALGMTKERYDLFEWMKTF